MLLAQGGGLILADFGLSFGTVLVARGLHVRRCLYHPLRVNLPSQPARRRTPKKLSFSPLSSTSERQDSVRILLFILPSTRLATPWRDAITTPFYLGLGFSKTEIGAVVKLFSPRQSPGTPWWSLNPPLASIARCCALASCRWSPSWVRGHWPTPVTTSPSWVSSSAARTSRVAWGTSAYIAFMASLTNKVHGDANTRCCRVSRAFCASSWYAYGLLLAENLGWSTFFGCVL